MQPLHREIVSNIWHLITAFSYTKGLSDICYISLFNGIGIELSKCHATIIYNNNRVNVSLRNTLHKLNHIMENSNELRTSNMVSK